MLLFLNKTIPCGYDLWLITKYFRLPSGMWQDVMCGSMAFDEAQWTSFGQWNADRRMFVISAQSWELAWNSNDAFPLHSDGQSSRGWPFRLLGLEGGPLGVEIPPGHLGWLLALTHRKLEAAQEHSISWSSLRPGPCAFVPPHHLLPAALWASPPVPTTSQIPHFLRRHLLCVRLHTFSSNGLLMPLLGYLTAISKFGKLDNSSSLLTISHKTASLPRPLSYPGATATPSTHAGTPAVTLNTFFALRTSPLLNRMMLRYSSHPSRVPISRHLL